MDYDVPHGLPLDQAKRAVQAAVASYAARLAKYAPDVKWTGDTHLDIAFSAKGLRLEGALDIDAEKLRVHLEVPFLLRPFQGRATQLIDREAAHWISKAKAGEI